MNKSGIGVQQILPRTSTDWQGGRRAPHRQNDKTAQADAPESEPAHAMPPPGLGKIIDKTI